MVVTLLFERVRYGQLDVDSEELQSLKRSFDQLLEITKGASAEDLEKAAG
jgi:hypothetical protein